jgi:hypothetical protein
MSVAEGEFVVDPGKAARQRNGLRDCAAKEKSCDRE